MKKRLYILSNGELKRKQNTLYFETDEGKKFIPVEGVSDLFIFGEVTLNKKFLDFLTKTKILIHFFNYYGYYIGTYYPREYYNSGLMILKQAEYYLDFEKRMNLAKKFVQGAVSNLTKVLTYYNLRGIDLNEYLNIINNLVCKIDECQYTEELMAIEGNIREQYYKTFDNIINSSDFSFETRSKRPPTNKLNALISFGNTLLYVEVLSEIYRTHLDPRIGYLHTTNNRRFTLNLDVAEIFKPIIVDRVIFSLLNKKIIKKSHFKEDLGGIYLKDNGRKKFLEKWEERLTSTIKHRGLKRNVSYRRLIRLELYKLEKHFLGDEEYKPFVARW
ncbi:CRISP-associated protein Cas1 [Desulfonauticus submarinus]|uniref:CRISPR-associated endonuclease Cas1 n=1 Tax=Desulfonauticus submarinus TaxID=206665 RepID=A0A1H0DPH2_9BACT|nr:type I-B CRISPR-associated endonuclease Cas1b [Desulfonauticus submarinus]SDN72054.1 CRISP-associated protein Cas1 [Desulfonauticus submarinus]